MRFRVEPGVYQIGSPDPRSPVLVTANYRLTFDMLRQGLAGVDAWILVLDTKGINVWCAAGKGTFGTQEVVRRVKCAQLDTLVSHRQLILPQLSAPGVAAHEVKQATGFSVRYGPVYAKDIPAYLASGYQATPEMRRVRFGWRDRLVLAPVEWMGVVKYIPLFGLSAFLMTWLKGMPSWSFFWSTFLPPAGALFMGAIAVPLLLPFLPSRSFAVKGGVLGLIWALLAYALWPSDAWILMGNLLLSAAITSFLALNFTGSTTYTSQSGVTREVRMALAPQRVAALLGLLCLLCSLIFD